MAGMDITSLLLAAGGAYVLSKMATGNNNEAFGQQPGTTTQGAASTTVLDSLQSLGVAVQPTDTVQQITTTTPAGQTVTYATVNYNPWAPAADQTVYLNPLDSARMLGWYIPQFPQWIKDAFGGEEKAFEWFKMYSQRIDATGVSDRVYGFEMPVRDWESLRLRDSREQPITPAEAAAAGFSLDDMVNLNGYWSKLQQAGGWIRGVEIHKGPRTSFNGLGRMANTQVAPKYYYFQ